jgi:hypothetical protein
MLTNSAPMVSTVVSVPVETELGTDFQQQAATINFE